MLWTQLSGRVGESTLRLGRPGRFLPRGSRGSGCADFPHPALRPTASLRDGGGTDARLRQRIAREQPEHCLPRYPCPLRAAAQPLAPHGDDTVTEVVECPEVSGTAAPWASLPRTQGAAPTSQGLFTGFPNTGSLTEATGPPRFLQDPTMNVPWSPTPAGPPRSANTALRFCLPPFGRRRLPRLPNISRLNHTARTSAVYASQSGLPHRHARLASGGWPALPGGTGYPPGPNERFQVIPSSFPRLRLAHPNCLQGTSALREFKQLQPAGRQIISDHRFGHVAPADSGKKQGVFRSQISKAP